MGGLPPAVPAMGGLPPAQDGRMDLLSAIRGANKDGLKHVDAESQSSAGSNDPKSALLQQIRAGGNLKQVDHTTNRKSDALEEDSGLAGALARALATRHKTIQGGDDDDDEDDVDDDDDEWDD